LPTLQAPLKVALLSYRSLPTSGGQGVYVRNLSRELVALGHQVEVFSGPPYPELDDGVGLTKLPSLRLYDEPKPFRWPRPGEFRDAVDVAEFTLMRTGQFAEPLTFTLRAARELGRSRRRWGPGPGPGRGPRRGPRRGRGPGLGLGRGFDIVHDNQSLGYGLLALRRSLAGSGVPVVATVHHPISVDLRMELAAATTPTQRFGLRRFYSFIEMQGRVARRLDGVLTVSQVSADQIVTEMGVPRPALRTIPLGADLDVFSPDPAQPRVPGRIVVVTSADVPLKGLGVLLEALAKIRVERPAQLVCVGRARPGGAAHTRIDALGLGDAVEFRSGLSRDELVALLRSSEVAVVPSLFEGFCLPAVEEMACGLPLVATRAGALPEVVGPDGEAAMLVPPGDAEALAGALGRLLADPALRTRLGTAGRARVEAGLSWRATARATADWYRERIAAAGAKRDAGGKTSPAC